VTLILPRSGTMLPDCSQVRRFDEIAARESWTAGERFEVWNWPQQPAKAANKLHGLKGAEVNEPGKNEYDTNACSDDLVAVQDVVSRTSEQASTGQSLTNALPQLDFQLRQFSISRYIHREAQGRVQYPRRFRLAQCHTKATFNQISSHPQVNSWETGRRRKKLLFHSSVGLSPISLPPILEEPRVPQHVLAA